jgi:localization factor PodJL
MSNVPWSVKGVEHEAREAAKLAARKAGLPLGVWLSQTIHAAAAQQLKSSSGPTLYAGSTHPSASSSGGGEAPAGSGIPRPPALTPEAVLESINRLAGRLAESEARTAEALAPIVEKVAKLSAQVEEGKGGPSRIDVDPLERAMMRMTERLDRIEEGRGGTPRPAERPTEGQNRRRPGFFSRLFSD